MNVLRTDEMFTGLRVKFQIDRIVGEGVIYEEDSKYYILQDHIDGAHPDNPNHREYGFKCSWTIGYADIKHGKYKSFPEVRMLLFLEEPVSLYFQCAAIPYSATLCIS